MTRWWWRLRAGASLAMIFVIAAAGPALAADDKAGPSGAVLDMFGVTTSDGLNLSQEDLGLSTRYKAFGKELPDPLLQIINVIWFLYRIIVGFSLWFLRTAQTGSWRTGLVDAADNAVTPFLAQLHDFGLPTVIGAFGCMIAAWAWVRGRAGASIAELGMVAVVFALATGIFASPAVTITEPGGWLDKSFSSARGMTQGMGEGGGDSTTRTEQRLADILVAHPAQLLTFGELLSEECSKKHVEALKEYGGKEEPEKIRESVAKCDERYDKGMPIEAVFGIGLFIWPFLSTVMAGLSALNFLMIFLVCAIIWFSIEIAWNALWAIAPGQGRVRLVNSLIKTGISLVALVVILVTEALISQVLVALFDSVRGEDGAGILDTFTAYAISSIVMSLLWIVLWWKVLAALLRSKKKTAQIKDKINPSKPVSMPAPSGFGRALSGIGQAAASGGSAALGAAIGRAGHNSPSGAVPQPAPAPAPAMSNALPMAAPTPGPSAARPAAQVGAAPQRHQLGPSSEGPAPSQPEDGPTGPHPAAPKGPDSLKKKLAMSTTRFAAQAALAAATGGTSTMASATTATVTRLAAHARQERLSKQLHAARTLAQLPPGESSQGRAPRRPDRTLATAEAPHALPSQARVSTPQAPADPGKTSQLQPRLRDMRPQNERTSPIVHDGHQVVPSTVVQERAQRLRERLGTPLEGAPAAVKMPRAGS